MGGWYCVACWEQLGRPPRTHLVEAGPGRGTLIAAILPATTPFADFQRSIEVQLIEVSPYMRAAQRRTLQRRAGGSVEPDDGADEARFRELAVRTTNPLRLCASRG